MTDRLDDSAPFDDDQGTRIPEKQTGAGQEAVQGTDGGPSDGNHQHRSGYGGPGSEPKDPNDIPRSRR